MADGVFTDIFVCLLCCGVEWVPVLWEAAVCLLGLHIDILRLLLFPYVVDLVCAWIYLRRLHDFFSFVSCVFR